MSSLGDTKRKILEMLERKSETLTEISKTLGLAPSTVSQHLRELLNAGRIRQVDDRPRKWKYYELNKGPITRGFGYDLSKGIIAIVAIAIIIGFAFYAFGGHTAAAAQPQQVYLAPGSAVPSGSTVFTLSDAPSFYNISALVITVNNASIHSESTGKWYKIPLQASTFDLVRLNNISTILSGVKLASGTYDNLILNISNVSATVNGTRQSVLLPSGKLIIVGDFNITNGSTNWINLDFDLQHSLHITGNGKIVMLPVINVRNVNGSSLELNESSIIIARSPGKIKEFEEFGMDENGKMTRNFSSPQNTSIESDEQGKLRFNSSGSVPIIIRTKRGFIIGGDARGLLNVTGYWNRKNSTANFSANVIGIGNGEKLNHWTNSTINISEQDSNGRKFSARCSFDNGALSCNTNQSLNTSVDQSEWAGFGSGIGIQMGDSKGDGKGINVNVSENSTANLTMEGNVTRGLRIRNETCANLTMGEC